MFTTEDKISCLQREIRMRQRVYPKRVMQEHMTESKADWELGCMQAILADYVSQQQPDLFERSNP